MSTKGTTANNKDIDFGSFITPGPIDAAVDREVRELLISARVAMLLKASFFGNLATRLRMVNADAWCATAATDGRHFYYNTKFIKLLKPREIEFLFGHEILHCVYDHMGRVGDRNRQLYNVAADYCVNADLKKHNIGQFITSVPCLYDAKYDGMSSEEVYDSLLENAKSMPQSGKGSLSELIKQVLDEHLDGSGDGEGDDKGDSKGNGNGNGNSDDGSSKRPTLSEEEKQQIRDEFKEAIISAAQTCDASNLPIGVKRFLQELTEPKMNWRELLRQQLESTIKSNYTWMRTSRKGWGMDAVMPGMQTQEAIDIAVMIDTSGSISEKQARDFLSEVKGIMEEFESYKIHVATFDTKVYNPQIYTSDNLEDVSEYEILGGGGTDFAAIFHWLKDEEVEPKKLVVFTDGYPCGSWGDPNYCDTVWIIHSNPSPRVPFGTWAEYQED